MRALVGLLLLASAAAAPACELEAAQRLGFDDATELFLRFAGEPPRVGAHFSLDLLLCQARLPFSPGRFTVAAVMPAHAHGMNYRPEILALGDGRYTANGLLFHMPGLWRLVFEIEHFGQRQRVEFDYPL